MHGLCLLISSFCGFISEFSTLCCSVKEEVDEIAKIRSRYGDSAFLMAGGEKIYFIGYWL